ncbi:tetratricopeptide repeat protein, partial [Myxococcota bacterium]|nr:tetratricopeptide repeat protein [Myxococcota bacterium]
GTVPPPLPPRDERADDDAVEADVVLAEEVVEDVAVVRGAPLSEGPIEGANPLPEIAREGHGRAPEVTVEPWFELVGPGEDIFKQPSAMTPVPVPKRPAQPLARRASVRGSVEENARSFHHSMSTESSNPNLDRDVALARARVVRSPNSVTACFRLGALLVKRGDRDRWDEALTTLKRVMELEPNHPGAHHALAEALARRGDYAGAAEHLARARRLGYRIDPVLEREIAEGRRG